MNYPASTRNPILWVKTAAFALLFAGTLAVVAQPRPASPTSSASIGLDQALMIYGEFSDRTVLRHPSLDHVRFTFSSTSTNRADIVTEIEAALEKSGILVVADGPKFVMVGLKSQAAALKPGSTNAPSTATKLYPSRSVDFHNAPVAQILTVHAAMLGKKIDPASPLPVAGEISLIQTCALSKEELLYAFETVTRWKGWGLVSSDNQNVKVVPLPRGDAAPSGK